MSTPLRRSLVVISLIAFLFLPTPFALGDSNETPASSSFRLAQGSIAAGSSHSCALTTNGGIKCWGINNYGEIGNGTTSPKLSPTNVSGLASGVVSISTGTTLSCALLETGAVKCWGSNFAGGVGDGTFVDKSIPTQVVGLTSGVVSISVGNGFGCAVTSAGELWCWGYNTFGRLGDGTETNRSTPVRTIASGVLDVSAGGYSACALLTGGAVKCWGYNSNGQVGDGTNTTRLTPVSVSGLTSNITAITVGEKHSCALDSTQNVKCWGENSFGQLGDTGTTEHWSPVDTRDSNGVLSGVRSLSSGAFNTCAVKNDGSAWCWGFGTKGTVGNGFTLHQTSAQPVTGLTGNVSAITVGTYHACALTSSGALKCWGGNNNYQLGVIAPYTDRLTPDGVSGLSSGIGVVTTTTTTTTPPPTTPPTSTSPSSTTMFSTPATLATTSTSVPQSSTTAAPTNDNQAVPAIPTSSSPDGETIATLSPTTSNRSSTRTTAVANTVASSLQSVTQATSETPASTTTSTSPLRTVSVPSVEPGTAVLRTETGDIEVQIVRENNKLRFTAGALRVTIDAIYEDGTAVSLDSSGNIRITKDSKIRIDSSGFVPNSLVEVRMYSDPILLGKVRTGVTGEFSRNYIVPTSTPDGKHRIVLLGSDPSHGKVTFAAGVFVGESAGSSTVVTMLIFIPLILAITLGLFFPAYMRRHKKPLKAL